MAFCCSINNLGLEWKLFDFLKFDSHLLENIFGFQLVLEGDFGVYSSVGEILDEKSPVLVEILWELVSELNSFLNSDFDLYVCGNNLVFQEISKLLFNLIWADNGYITIGFFSQNT